MRKLSPEELKYRLQLDYRVCQFMFGQIFSRGPVFSGKAYRSSEDLEKQRNPITVANDGQLAKKYRVDFHVRTLVGPSRYSTLTTIGFDLDRADYPHTEPATWVIGGQIPFSPHFKQGSPVCIGEIWQRSNGYMLLGQLLVHIARLLNWDEIARGGGYVGWNGEAIEYHKNIYHGKPITEGLQYPVLPPDVYGIDENATDSTRSLFRPVKPVPGVEGTMFKGKGRT